MFSSSRENTRNNNKTSAAENLEEITKNEACRMTENLSDYAKQAGHEAQRFINSATEEFKHAKERVTDEIQGHPVRSSLVALGIGFILGALFRR